MYRVFSSELLAAKGGERFTPKEHYLIGSERHEEKLSSSCAHHLKEEDLA